MCDFFWLSPADQGDLSDVVRASLQQQPPPHHRLPPATATVCSHGSLGGSRHLPEEEEPLLPLQAHGNGGMGFMVGRDHASLYPQLHQKAAPEGLLMIPQLISGRRPQLCASGGSSFAVEREDNAANAPVVLDELGQMDMAAMAPHHPPHAPSIKRRKSQTKKVVCIPAPVAAPAVAGGGRASTSGGEVVPSDLWAWRKYGQKPIKGSPYPRGYYRCSSSKGCSARKQVERSRTDPSMLVITYTSDHNHPWPTHRNALAGSTRPPPGAASSSPPHHTPLWPTHRNAPAASTRPPPAAASSSYSSSAAAKSHHHQQQHRRHASALAAAVSDPAPPHHRRADDVAVADNNAIHHHQLLLKQEVLDMDNCLIKPAQDDAAADDDDHDLLGGMIADVDGALNALCATTFHSKKQQQHATADHWEKLPEDEEDKQQLLLLDRGDPFSFSFLDWVGASFGVGEATANKGGYS